MPNLAPPLHETPNGSFILRLEHQSLLTLTSAKFFTGWNAPSFIFSHSHRKNLLTWKELGCPTSNRCHCDDSKRPCEYFSLHHRFILRISLIIEEMPLFCYGTGTILPSTLHFFMVPAYLSWPSAGQ